MEIKNMAMGSFRNNGLFHRHWSSHSYYHCVPMQTDRETLEPSTAWDLLEP